MTGTDLRPGHADRAWRTAGSGPGCSIFGADDYLVKPFALAELSDAASGGAASSDRHPTLVGT